MRNFRSFPYTDGHSSQSCAHPSSMGSTATVIPGHQQPQQLQRQGLAQGSGKPNTLPSAQLLTAGLIDYPSDECVQHAVDGCSDSWFGLLDEGGTVPVSMNPPR
jgi:hypothetical protein